MLRVVPRSVVVAERLLLVLGQECDGTSWPVTAPEVVVAHQTRTRLTSQVNFLEEGSPGCERVQRPHDLPEPDVVALQVATDQISESVA